MVCCVLRRLTDDGDAGVFLDNCRLLLVPSTPRAPFHISPQSDGDTPLHNASYYGQVAVVQYLVETAKADVAAKDVSEKEKSCPISP